MFPAREVALLAAYSDYQQALARLRKQDGHQEAEATLARFVQAGGIKFEEYEDLWNLYGLTPGHEPLPGALQLSRTPLDSKEVGDSRMDDKEENDEMEGSPHTKQAWVN